MQIFTKLIIVNTVNGVVGLQICSLRGLVVSHTPMRFRLEVCNIQSSILLWVNIMFYEFIYSKRFMANKPCQMF
jgi:hypothetical protein